MFNRSVLKMILILLTSLFLFSCAQKGPALSPSALQQLDAGMYASKVDNFSVILDTSSSMYDRYNGNRKFEIAKRVASDMNITLPEMGQTAGLRTLGHDPKVSPKATELFYGMEKYTSAGFAQGLSKVTKTGGTTPLPSAVKAAGDDLSGLSGTRNALIIISDGLETSKSSAQEARILKDKYGASLCIYTILVGNSPAGEALMKEMTTIGGCGFFTTADALLDAAAMKNFVETVFLMDKPVEKAVAPAPAPAAAPGPKDSDNDGVTDDIDECPDTPAGARVNAVGCWVLDQVLFDYDKAVVKPEAYAFLDEVVVILKKNPSMAIILQGHTDNIGTARYNDELSLRRASAVKEYIEKQGISDIRLTTQGFGFSKPAASNNTDEGRSLNRRVEIQPNY